MGIWNDPDAEWTSGDGLRAVQLFDRAYPEPGAAQALAARIGIPGLDALAPPASSHEVWARLLALAAKDGRTLDLAAELLQDADRDRFWMPLTTLLGDQLGAANTRRIDRHGLPEDPTASQAIIDTLDVAEVTSALIEPAPPLEAEEDDDDEDEEGPGLQSVTVPSEGILANDQVIRIHLGARRRVCLIRANGRHVATGFLVGPDLLLTAAHALDDQWPPVRGVEGLEAVFDFSDAGASAAETGVSVPVAEVLDGSPPTNGERTGIPTEWEAPESQLDFALLRLARRVADDPTPDTTTRGHYRIDTQSYDLTASPKLTVFHYADGKFLQTSFTTGGFEHNTLGTRIRYRSNTLRGSSGGPLIDSNGRLVAMHHFSTAKRNQAIPIWLIASAVSRGPAARMLDAPPAPGPGPQGPLRPAATAPNPYRVLQIGPRPLVGRDPLRSKIEAMATDQAARSLVIHGATDSGVSWSYWLLSHVASQALLVPELKLVAPGGLQAIRVDLRTEINASVASRRAALVRTIGRWISATEAEETLAQVARQVSDFKRWCFQQLLVSDRQWWLFVDSIDEVAEVARHGIDEILVALVELAEDPQMRLRLVLAGREADKIAPESLEWAAKDQPVGLSREEVKRWIEARVVHTGRVLAPGKLDAFLERWFPGVATAADPNQLALALPAAVVEVAA